MPVMGRPAIARERGITKFREKRKMGRLMEFLMYGVLITLTGDSAYKMFECVRNCPAPGFSESPDIQITTLPWHGDKIQKPLVAVDTASDLHQRLKDLFKSPKPTEECIVLKPNCLTARQRAMDRAISDSQWRAKNINDTTIDEEIPSHVVDLLEELIRNQDLDAMAQQQSAEPFQRIAMHDPVLFVSSF